jgi:tetratricopeptide (TPR) repeat protein
MTRYPLFSLFVFLSFLFLACQKDGNNQNAGKDHDHSQHDHSAMSMDGKAAEQDEETKAMVRRLQVIANNPDPGEMWHQNEKLARALDIKIQQSQSLEERLPYIFQSGLQWLNAGNYDKSIFLFGSVIDLIERGKIRLNEQSTRQFYEMLAISHLRKGEIENCLQNHSALSCIIPLDPSARHQLKTGSEKALEYYQDILFLNPNDLQSRWLLNIAHMTLGTYPEQVPPEWLIPESVFASERAQAPFVDKAMEAGLAVNDISGGCILDDFNQDGLLDVIATSYGLSDQVHYFVNQGNGKFADKTLEAGLQGIVSGLNTLQADYDNDGDLDFLILRGAWLGRSGKHPNSLLRNNGDGTFSDVTESAGLLSYHPTQSASWADFNLDGWLDLFIGNESTTDNYHPSELYLNQQDGSFKEVASEYNMEVNAFVKGCVWGDYNNDGNPDLFISNLTGKNLLFENQGKENGFKFVEKAKEAGVQLPEFSFPCWFWDFNNDGWLDIYVNSYNTKDFNNASAKVAADYLGQAVETEYSCLYQNRGNGTFANVTKSVNLEKVLYTMGCNFGDIDNDGFPDFYASTGTPDFRSVFPNRLFRNYAGRSFQDVTTPAKVGHIQKGHGVAFGDVDNDGDQDIYVVLGGSYSGDNFMNALFENPGVKGNNWLYLQLEGVRSNKSAIGARVRVTGTQANGISRTVHTVVNSGASFGASTLRQEIGLGQIETITEVVVEWPIENSTNTYTGLSVNRMYKLVEGNEQPAELSLSSFKF